MIALLVQALDVWLLGPDDLKVTPSHSSPYTAQRKEIEDRFFATPLYARKAMAKRELRRSQGFALILWTSLASSWQGPDDDRPPKGNWRVDKDREILRARLLADYRRVYSKHYNGLFDRLMDHPDAKSDYRLLRAAVENAYRIGGKMEDGLGYAKAAEALKPNNPTSWRATGLAHMNDILYGVGNGNENWKEYVRYTDRFKKFALASKTGAGLEDVRRLDLDRKWIRGYLGKNYRPDGTLKVKKP